MNIQACRARPEVANINSNEFFPYSVLVNKCGGNFNNTNDSYEKLCVSDVARNIHVKVFKQSRINEARHIEWHETSKCKSRLDASFSNGEQRWNKYECRCECKELIGKGMCDKGFIWNPRNCEYECYKSCDVGEYLDVNVEGWLIGWLKNIVTVLMEIKWILTIIKMYAILVHYALHHLHYYFFVLFF